MSQRDDDVVTLFIADETIQNIGARLEMTIAEVEESLRIKREEWREAAVRDFREFMERQ